MNHIKSIFPQYLKNIYHLSQAILANLWYGFPSKKLKVIGITGTNGKTTTTQMIARILEEAGKKIAVASTINFKIGEKEWINATKFTTLSAFGTQKFIKQALDAGCEYLVLETSSHSLDQNRVWGVNYKTAVITNITREHLDYHKTIDQYSKAKQKLFKMVSKNSGTIVVNLDMNRPEDFLKYPANKKYAYIVCHSEFDSESGSRIKSVMTSGNTEIVKAEDINLGMQDTRYRIQNTEYQLQLPGEFNIENALAATCVGLSENISLEKIKSALEKIKNVPGRFEFVPNTKNINIIVDYAVTSDSLEKLYELIAKINTEKKKVIAVFGSCGDRDRGKRPIMGEIVSKCADYAIVANEDPYGEDPVSIINEVFSGVVGFDVKGKLPNFQFPISNFQTNPNDKISNDKKIEGVNCWRILDRREAIKNALKLANVGDFVVVTGKGAEETMAIGKERIPWNDRKVIEEELEKL